MSHQDTLIDEERKAKDSVRIALGLGGLISLILGILILVNPLKTGAVMMQIVAVIVAIYMVAVGVIYLGSAFFSKTMKGWPRTGNILLGGLYVIAGIIIFSNVAGTALVLAGFLSIVIGVMWIAEAIVAITNLKSTGHRVLTAIYAVLSLIAGVVLILSPWLGAITLWMLIGISMIVLGVMQVIRAFSIKP